MHVLVKSCVLWNVRLDILIFYIDRVLLIKLFHVMGNNSFNEIACLLLKCQRVKNSLKIYGFTYGMFWAPILNFRISKTWDANFIFWTGIYLIVNIKLEMFGLRVIMIEAFQSVNIVTHTDRSHPKMSTFSKSVQTVHFFRPPPPPPKV